MAFITYYDLREAEKAKNGLQDAEVEGRPIDLHYSIPREDEENDDQDPNNGTLFVVIKDPLEKYSNDDVYNLFRQWGDVKEVRDCKGKQHQKFVECWDLRHTDFMYKQKQGTPFAGGTLDIKHAYKSSRERDRDRDRDREGGKPVRRKNGENTQVNNNTNPYPLQSSGGIQNNQLTSLLTQLLLSQSLSGVPITTTTDKSQMPIQSLLYNNQPNVQTSNIQNLTPTTYSTLGTNYMSGYNNLLSLPQLSSLSSLYSTLPQGVNQTPSTYSLQNQQGTLGTNTLNGSNLGNLTMGTNTLSGVQPTLGTTQYVQTLNPNQPTSGYSNTYQISPSTYNPYTYIPQ